MAEAGTAQQLNALANLLLLQQRLREAQNPAELGFVLVNDTQALAPYRSGLLWVVGKTDPDQGAITNVSGAVDHDEHSPFMSWMQALCQALAKTGDAVLTQYKKEDVPAEIADQWDIHGAQYLLWCPLRSGSGVRLGALLLWREQAISEPEERILGNWLAAASYSLAALKGKPFAREHFHWTARRKRIVAGISVLVFLLLFLPVRLSVA